MELDDTVPILEKKIPDIAKYPVYADNARPESISHLGKKGLRRIVGVEKGKGSVEDGIAFIKSFQKVVIHPRCSNTIQEFRDYAYKIDRPTDEILPILIDKNNHYIDALRYGLEKIMKQRRAMKISRKAIGAFSR